MDPHQLNDEQWVEMRAQAVWLKQHYLLNLAQLLAKLFEEKKGKPHEGF